MTFLRGQWDRVLAWVAVALGALLLLFGWLGVSGTGYVFEQLPYVVSGGIGGLFLLGVGAMLWISADLRDEWRKLDRLERVLSKAAGRYDEPEPVGLPLQTADEQSAVAFVAEPVVERPRAARVRRRPAQS